MINRQSLRSSELKSPLIGGLVAALTLFTMVVLVGRVGSFEALRLIESVLPGARFLASAAIGGSLTVLALLLTLLGFSMSSEYTFHTRLYTRVSYITTLGVVTIIMSAGLLLAVGVPIAEVDKLRPFYATLLRARRRDGSGWGHGRVDGPDDRVDSPRSGRRAASRRGQ